MSPRFLSLVLLVLLALNPLRADHPQLYATDADRDALVAKIKDEPWAAQAWKDLSASIDPCVARTRSDPQWVVSRLAMYW